jgi:transposase
VRTLSVSRTTVRKVIRSRETEFKYERGVQPVPKLGEWLDVLTEILEKEAKLPRRERRSTQRLFEELRGRGYDGAQAACTGSSRLGGTSERGFRRRRSCR